MAYAGGLWVSDEGHKRRRATKVRIGERLCLLTQDHAEGMRVFPDGGPRQYGLALHHSQGVEILRGPEVHRVIAQVIPALTPFGGDHQQVNCAIEMIDSSGSAQYYINDALESANREYGFFTKLPVESRLALEMSLQEDGERRALNGELAALERAWRDAEQIAAIADSLLVPGDVLERIAGLRKEVRSPGFAFS